MTRKIHEFHKLAMLKFKIQIIRKRFSNWTVDYLGLERHKNPRVALNPCKPCRILELRSHRETLGMIENISSRGMALRLDSGALKDRVCRVSFYDEVTGRDVSSYVMSLNDPIFFPLRTKREHKGTAYRFHIEPSLCPSADFLQYYQRILSDSYIHNLNHHETRPTKLPSLVNRNIHFKIAETIVEKEAAYRLVYKEYLRRGFTDPNPYGMFTYRYQLLPETTTMIGVLNGTVVMTLSAIKDSVFKLPMDQVFSDILEPIRAKNRRLVEYGMLATEKELFGNGAYCLKHFRKMSVLFSLIRITLQHSMQVHQATDIVIAIPPRYQNLYHYLCFNKLADLRYYGKYNTPALAMAVDLVKVTDLQFVKQAGRLCLMRYFFGKKLDVPLTPSQGCMSEEAIQHLFAEKSDLIDRLTDDELQTIRANYPDLNSRVSSVLEKRRSHSMGDIAV